jgi:hypothetical protein
MVEKVELDPPVKGTLNLRDSLRAR